jgi:uncharacterized phage-associated protein
MEWRDIAAVWGVGRDVCLDRATPALSVPRRVAFRELTDHLRDQKRRAWMADTFAVANQFLALAKQRGDALTPMQLLKLVYIAHGWMLGLYGRPLIKDEIQAWQYGPVIRRLYDVVRQYRSQPVDVPIATVSSGPMDPQEQSVIEQAYKIYGSMSGPALSRLTHAAGTPWAQTYKPGAFGVVIPNDIIEDHYARLARERQRAP